MSTLTVRLLNYAMLKYIPKFIFLSAILLSACTSSSYMGMGDTGSLSGLLSMGCRKCPSGDVSKIREMALKETALTVGAQSGLACRARVIDEELNRNARNLDTVFDFNSLILEHNILPPVLLEGRSTFNLADTHTIRLSDRNYKIAKQARFITTPPNWRQYLWMDFVKPEPPHMTLLPKTKEEQQIWCTYVEKGWKNGIEQANIILEENLARIKEDFVGMILYRKLLAMNMVSPPFVTHTDLGVTGNGSELHIDDRVLRITALPTLNINSEEWRAAVAKKENELEKYKNMTKLAQRSKIIITSKAWQPIIAPVNK